VSYTDAEAENAVLGAFRTAWLASGTTSSIGLLWPNVEGTEEDLGGNRYDAEQNPLPYARPVFAVLVSGQETLGPVGVAKYLTEAILRVQIFTPPGDGYALASSIVEDVLKPTFRGVSIGELWFFDVFATRGGRDKAWMRTDFRASCRYVEK